MASGDTLAWFVPQCHEPPVANYGRRDARNTTSPHPIVDLAVGESFIASLLLVQGYAGTTGVTIYVHFAMTSATSGNIKLETYFERIGEVGNLDTDSWGSAQNTGDVAVPTGTAGDVKIASVAHTDGTQMDSLAKGEMGRLKIKRVTATSEASGDLEIRGVEIRET